MIKSELSAIAGTEYVSDDHLVIAEYSSDHSFLSAKKPTCVVKPKDTEEIQEIIRLANKHKIPVIPISSGIHFYGATLPDQSGVVVDLSRMNRILKVDARNRAVRIEPGVTWDQLQDEVTKHGLRVLNPLLPHATKSALTSSLEREPMLVPKTEYGEPILTMEVVLPTGEIFRTGSASVGPPDEIQPDLVGPYGPGLDFFRLFQGAQGTLCIVTWVNLKAPMLPKLEKLFFIPCQKIEEMVEPLFAIQRPMLGSECLVLNDFNLASILAEDWPDDFEFLKELLPPFTLLLNLSGGKRLPEKKIAYEENDLMDICQGFGLEPLPNLPGITNIGELLPELLRRPWKQETYWKERSQGRSADIFFYTTLERVPEFTKTVYEQATRYGYSARELGIYIQPIERARACYLEYNFPWDPQAQNDRERITKFHRELSVHLLNMGAFFTRPYGPWSEMVYNRNTTFTVTLRNLKEIFDPNHIMNPGKLCV
jgi:FAD/FMN-containing dehydrogenase